jgi:hypothetical protein
MAERKRRAAERDTRRESLFVLLSRARRGVPLTPAEAALMFAHVEVELTEADELRRTVAGQQNAIQAAHDRTAAAEEAIRETEQRAVDAEEQLTAYRAVYGEGSDNVATIFREFEAARLAAEERAAQAEAQLDEQRATTVACLDASGAALTRALDRADNAEDAARTAIDNHGRAEAELATLRKGIRECGGNPTSVQNLAATLQLRNRQWRAAEHRATRYRTAWFAARRDRRADRAAMAAELPLAMAGVTVAEATEGMRQWGAAGISAAQLAEPTPVTLATPCANPDCEHPRNWHAQHLGCVSRGGACSCSGFEPPTARP